VECEGGEISTPYYKNLQVAHVGALSNATSPEKEFKQLRSSERDRKCHGILFDIVQVQPTGWTTRNLLYELGSFRMFLAQNWIVKQEMSQIVRADY
jgi:hypothetical protein